MEGIDFLSFAQEVSTLDRINYQYFNQLLNNRTIILNEEIGDNILECVIIPLREFEKDDCSSEVTLILNTIGGSIADGLALCTVLDTYKKPIKVIVPSYACSMGTLMLCAGNKNPNVTKIAYPFAFGLFHSGQTFVGGESTSVEDIMDFNKGVDAAIRNYVINNTKITAELYDSHNRKQWYITAQDMKNYGLVHKIVGDDDDE